MRHDALDERPQRHHGARRERLLRSPRRACGASLNTEAQRLQQLGGGRAIGREVVAEGRDAIGAEARIGERQPSR